MSETDPPVDRYGLRLLRLVAEHQSITSAAAAAGLTQSALTRQVSRMEGRLGLALFERSTRCLKVTPAGRTLLRETAQVAPIMEAAVRLTRESHSGAEGELRIGVSRSVSLAHMPGLLHAWMSRPGAEAKLAVFHLGGAEILEAVAENRLDVGILGAPRATPRGCAIAHRMADRFVLIAPKGMEFPGRPGEPATAWNKGLRAALERALWLMLPSSMQTRQDMDAWLRKCSVFPARVSEFDSFDLIVQLVTTGLGIALVPRRALAGFPRGRRVRTVPLPEFFERELVAVTRAGAVPRQARRFIDSILFS